MTNWTKFRPFHLAVVLLLLPGITQAQQAQPADPAGSYAQPAAATNFSDAELKSFALVRQKVDAIRTEVTGKLRNTQDQQEIQKLQQEADARMVAAVEKAGLTREKYNEIARAAMSDPALAEKLARLQ